MTTIIVMEDKISDCNALSSAFCEKIKNNESLKDKFNLLFVVKNDNGTIVLSRQLGEDVTTVVYRGKLYINFTDNDDHQIAKSITTYYNNGVNPIILVLDLNLICTKPDDTGLTYQIVLHILQAHKELSNCITAFTGTGNEKGYSWITQKLINLTTYLTKTNDSINSAKYFFEEFFEKYGG